MLCIKSIETEEVKLMLGVSLIIIAAAIVYMVETYISTYYTCTEHRCSLSSLRNMARQSCSCCSAPTLHIANSSKSRKLRLLLHLNGLQAKKSCIPTKFKRH